MKIFLDSIGVRLETLQKTNEPTRERRRIFERSIQLLVLFNPFLGNARFRKMNLYGAFLDEEENRYFANLINWGNMAGINLEKVLSDRMKLFVADRRGAICTARDCWIDLEPCQIFARAPAWFNASLEISTRPICRVCPNNCNKPERIIGRAGKNNSGRVFLVAFTDNRYYGC